MRSPAHRNYRAGEPSRVRSAGVRPRRAHTNNCSGSRTPQADVAGGASRAHWYITVRSQIGASFSSFSGYREGFASSLRRASLFYHTWQHERSFVWAWSASCGTNRSFKAFVKFTKKRLRRRPRRRRRAARRRGRECARATCARVAVVGAASTRRGWRPSCGDASLLGKGHTLL